MYDRPDIYSRHIETLGDHEFLQEMRKCGPRLLEWCISQKWVDIFSAISIAEEGNIDNIRMLIENKLLYSTSHPCKTIEGYFKNIYMSHVAITSMIKHQDYISLDWINEHYPGRIAMAFDTNVPVEWLPVASQYNITKFRLYVAPDQVPWTPTRQTYRTALQNGNIKDIELCCDAFPELSPFALCSHICNPVTIEWLLRNGIKCRPRGSYIGTKYSYTREQILWRHQTGWFTDLEYWKSKVEIDVIIACISRRRRWVAWKDRQG